MKKFIFLYYGYVEPTPEIHEAWGKWFESIGDRLVDGGNPFGAGREITKDGTTQLSVDQEAITGYSIIRAENMDEAEKIAQSHPYITAIRIYEAMPM